MATKEYKQIKHRMAGLKGTKIKGWKKIYKLCWIQTKPLLGTYQVILIDNLNRVRIIAIDKKREYPYLLRNSQYLTSSLCPYTALEYAIDFMKKYR